MRLLEESRLWQALGESKALLCEFTRGLEIGSIEIKPP